ncbi:MULTISPECIES: galactokinase [Corynebacterium]|uniref:Galactokinase n=1 Tax=Corynebacterium glucuronolyticum TaxID=39791 RepID=A0A7T4EEB6_9CORY|nr:MULTISPECIES: galactokinase [Corynebacterium]EEI27329.1 galactokinase [Corynebacterium glucuronolyticum ATCC 51867]MCT1442401.1 galactokinase [Corynebacterium glucuronolyticum]MCT1564566.1 galactokinase [Corynebacterium glucuronolyticum]OFO47509.1 galactokinase [Corynebacterium sp. HMSC073D01]QQB45820.1 galactokinase [Corynebacterium glucuronolyticum]
MATTHWATTRTEEQLVNDAKTLFTSTYDEEPTGVWAAPGRVNLIGDHVDYAEGICLPFALEQLTAIAAAGRNDHVVNIITVMPGQDEPQRLSMSLEEVGKGNPATWAGYVVGVIWALNSSNALVCKTGMDIAVVSDVPVGSGLSSSAALECSTALAAVDVKGSSFRKMAMYPVMVEATMRAENDVVGASTGGLDQRTSFYGKKNQALEIDFLYDEFTYVPCNFADHGLAVLVADTNAPHRLIDGQYGSRRGLIDEVTAVLRKEDSTFRDFTVEQVLELLAKTSECSDHDLYRRRVGHVISETQRTQHAVSCLRDGDFSKFGKLMTESHASLRDDYAVVTPELDCAVNAALSAGALGARMTGGGFGGSIIALVKKENMESTAQSIAEAAEARGFEAPTFLEARPSHGARRLA